MERRNELLETKCPMIVAQKIMAGKWKLLIIYRLKDGAMRFSQLQRTLPGITQATLTQQLRELEQDEIVHREIYKEIPPKVEYTLTDIGEKFLKVLANMSEWGLEYIDYLKD